MVRCTNARTDHIHAKSQPYTSLDQHVRLTCALSGSFLGGRVSTVTGWCCFVWLCLTDICGCFFAGCHTVWFSCGLFSREYSCRWLVATGAVRAWGCIWFFRANVGILFRKAVYVWKECREREDVNTWISPSWRINWELKTKCICLAGFISPSVAHKCL